jgi:rare lipoprotein A
MKISSDRAANIASRPACQGDAVASPASHWGILTQGLIVVFMIFWIQACLTGEGGIAQQSPAPAQPTMPASTPLPAIATTKVPTPTPDAQSAGVRAEISEDRTKPAAGGSRPSPGLLSDDDPRAALARERGVTLPLVPNDGDPVAYPSQVGQASFYAGHIKEVEGIGPNPLGLTAAHKSLPLGTLVRCTRLDKGDAVVVVITDRGPFIEGRIIDLSPEAAAAIGLDKAGTVRCRVEVLAYPKNKTPEKSKKE